MTRCTPPAPAEYVEDDLRALLHLPTASRVELWEEAARSSERQVKEMVDCICKQAGWRRKAVAKEIASVHEHLSSATLNWQMSVTAVDLVVPSQLHRRQAAALQCLAEAYDVAVNIVNTESVYKSETV